MEHTDTIAVSVALMYTSPIFVMIYSVIFLKERITLHKIIAITLALLGCVMVSGVFESAGAVKPSGIVFGILSAMTYALYGFLSKIATNRNYNAATIIVYSFFMASIITLPFIISGISKAIAAPEAVVYIIGIGVFSSFLPFYLYTRALKYIESSTTSIIVTTELLFAAVVGYVLLNETLSIYLAIGGCLIVAGVFFVSVRRKTIS